MNAILIRPYQDADEKQIIDLWFECNLVTPWNNPKRDIERKLADSPDLFFVAVTADEIIGTCMAGCDGHRGWIYYLAVKPEYQRKGIASRLMQQAEEKLMSLGCPKIDLMVRNTNQEAVEFYKNIGYNEDPVVVLSRRLYEDEQYKA